MTTKRYPTPQAAFAARTERQGNCLVWKGADTGQGEGKAYGLLRVDGKPTLTHRFAWEQTFGPIPDGYQIDHTCFNRKCANVAHLRLVTPKQNGENRKGANANSTTGVRGVHWLENIQRFRARVVHNGVTYDKKFKAEDFDLAVEWAEAKRAELFTHSTN